MTANVIGCAIKVDRTLGPGLLESTDEPCLARELSLQGVGVELQALIPVEEIKGVHEAQLLTYMKLAAIGTGLWIHFNVRLLKDGIKRFQL